YEADSSMRRKLFHSFWKRVEQHLPEVGSIPLVDILEEHPELILERICLTLSTINNEAAFKIVHICWLSLEDLWVSVGLKLIDVYMAIDKPKIIRIMEAFSERKNASFANLEAALNQCLSSYRQENECCDFDLMPTLVCWS